MEYARLKIYQCGENHLELVNYLHRGSKVRGVVCRGGRTGKPTSKEQEKYNDRITADRIRRYVKTNFSCGRDMFATLTYQPDCAPLSHSQVVKDMGRLAKRMQRWYNKTDFELIWLYVIEVTKAGAYHIHMFYTEGMPGDVLERVWGNGDVKVRTVSNKTLQLDDVAAYVAKCPKGKQAYHCSTNIKSPTEETDDKLMDVSVFKSLAYEEKYDVVAVKAVMEQLFPGYRMVIRDDQTTCGYYCEYLNSPYLFVEMERIQDASERSRQYSNIAKQNITPLRQMHDKNYWNDMADDVSRTDGYSTSFMRRLDPDQRDAFLDGVA
ncbi:MAG: hypothetical protein IJ601_05165 [Acidaminococcaceae bacterium]|nr:hypothetical protein [Acidaminococcaceae bacterium]